MAAIGAALKLITTNPQRVKRLQENASLLHHQLIQSFEIQSDPRTPVTAIHPASPQRALKLRQALLKAGIFPPYIHYLGGPAAGFFRFAMTSEHKEEDVQTLARTINSVLSSSRNGSNK
jgi:7-keto-8-aminopelargonate synthetase-like enzyme